MNVRKMWWVAALFGALAVIGGCGDSGDDDVVVNETLFSPTDVTSSATSSNSITITWNPVSNADGYYIYRSSTLSGSYTQIGTSTTTTYVSTGLQVNTNYYYRVAAYNSTETSELSIPTNVTTPAATFAPFAPIDLSATAISSSSIRISWTPVGGTATGYYIYRSLEFSGTYTRIADVISTSYTDTELLSGTKYYYRVVAYDRSIVGMAMSSVFYAMTQ